MNVPPPVQDFASRYYWARAISPMNCCGCFNNHLGGLIACLIWAALSFYFAVLAFMNQSPFYSHLDKVPLIIFGVVNVLFGSISVLGFILLIRPRFDRISIMVYVIAAGATVVLVDMLINFILFAANQGTFQAWCIDHSRAVVQTTLSQQQGSNITVNSDSDYYNCDRLFDNQVKWSLLSVIAMFIVYTHWVLVITAFAGTSFFLIPPRTAPAPVLGVPPPLGPEMGPPPPPPPPGTEILHNLPSSKEYKSVRPLRKKTDESILAMLGLRVNDSGSIIHISNESSLPYYYDRRRDSRASDTSLLK